MNILVTGAKGFVGKNLCAQLRNIRDGKICNYNVAIEEVYEYDVDSTPEQLDRWCSQANFVFNLAGVNRPKDPDEFMSENFGFASILLDSLKKHNNFCPVMISSSIQAELDNPYGNSKRAGENLMFRYSKETGAKVLVYRFPNVFGKWCRPNYNSVIATFCNNIANGLPITINDPNVIMHLVYIDDVVDELISALAGHEHKNGKYCIVPIIHTARLGDIVDMLYSFSSERETLYVPNVGDPFTKKLLSTYISYLPKKNFKYPLRMNIDERGSFTEILRTSERGQFSVNVSKPGVMKGQHWHHTKYEKFLVVSGRGLIQLRRIGTEEVIEFEVSDKKMEVVEMIPGYTHNIVNLSNDDDLVTFMWCNECFDPQRADTYSERV